jgi:hypothetical protein
LQQTVGNRAVGQLVQRQQEEAPAPKRVTGSKISASGAGTVAVKYTPKTSDKSTKIVFIQVMRNYLDGSPAKPSQVHASFAYRDADTTKDFYHVDYVSGESDPYYNGDDLQDGGTQGDAMASPKVDAAMTDTPDYQDHHFPGGKSKLKWEFRTIAFSAAGTDQGKFYEYARWTYDKEKGKTPKITHQGTSTETALPKNRAAIKLWASNHGFTIPK